MTAECTAQFIDLQPTLRFHRGKHGRIRLPLSCVCTHLPLTVAPEQLRSKGCALQCFQFSASLALGLVAGAIDN